ncbi:MAG: hypothetical protein INF12_14515 [Methylobacterium sp.]|nr:hypothetical protein [Methylobacterium sp.]
MTDALREEIAEAIAKADGQIDFESLPEMLKVVYTLQAKYLEPLIARARAEEREASFKDGYLAGFMASGEGWNGEYPHATKERYLADKYWIGRRDNALNGYLPKRDDG